ncbi:MAG: uncharacterized protein QG670_730 [Thermoproteota archaeon]|nr:uncharacterized protein [Thermoproteota archaeon]
MILTSRIFYSQESNELYPKTKRFLLEPWKLGIGRFIIVLIAIVGVVVFILFENWWLDVKILTSMFSNKAGIDWWKINFLDNYYFYICIAVGLIVALSDPRIIIEKDSQGKRSYYLHSKFWVMINAIVGQILKDERNPFSPGEKKSSSDRISLKRGLLWKSLEFLAGMLVIGPMIAASMATVYLMLLRWIEIQQITWIVFIQNSLSAISTRLSTPETLTGEALGAWLIANSPNLEFLNFTRTFTLVFVGIWSVRFVISTYLDGFREKNLIKIFRNIAGIAFLLLIPYVLQIPTLAFDITTPFYVTTAIIALFISATFFVFLSLTNSMVQLVISRIVKNRIILSSIIIIILASLLYGPIVVAVQYAPAMGGHYEQYLWQPKYLPNVVYTQWATGIEPIKAGDINAAINTGTNLDILSRIRVFNDASAKLRLTPSIGVNWMDFSTPVPPSTTSVDIVYVNGKEYWLAPLTIVMPPGGTAEDQWRSSRMLITHSERILAMDAATGGIVPIQSVFNLTKPSYSIYYGEDGLLTSSAVYIGIPNIAETHLSNYTGPAAYNGAVDYLLSGFDRVWFFSGLYRREQLRLDFARGDYGDVKMLFMRDISQRLSQILLPGMTLDPDPYIVSDGDNIYYSLYVYIERSMPTQYLDYPNNQHRFLRLFATILINAYDGSIQGYLLGSTEDNYILDFYRGMYPQWNQPVPTWLQSRLRYPEFLFDKQIVSYDTYHVSDPDLWQRGTDFFELTTDSNGNPIEDVRYVSFYLNGTTYWAAVRLVEYANSPGKNLAGMYVALNGENIGDVSMLRTGNVAVIGPQTALDTINNYGPTQTQLTLNRWQSGNVLMYVINNKPYYFVPYYGGTATTLNPAMMVVVDAMSQKIGYYIIINPQDPVEVSSSSNRAYLNLIGATVVQTAEARKTNILNEVIGRGYTIKTPQQLFPNVEFQEASINYLSDADLAVTNATISSFISKWVLPYSLSTILEWETIVSNVKYLNLGVLINIVGIVELHYLAIAYG